MDGMCVKTKPLTTMGDEESRYIGKHDFVHQGYRVLMHCSQVANKHIGTNCDGWLQSPASKTKKFSNKQFDEICYLVVVGG